MKLFDFAAGIAIAALAIASGPAEAQQRDASPALASEPAGIIRYVETDAVADGDHDSQKICGNIARAMRGKWLNRARIDGATKIISCEIGFDARTTEAKIDAMSERYARTLQRRRANAYETPAARQTEVAAKPAPTPSPAKPQPAPCNRTQAIFYFESPVATVGSTLSDVEAIYNAKALETVQAIDLKPNEQFVLNGFSAKASATHKSEATLRVQAVENLLTSEHPSRPRGYKFKANILGSDEPLHPANPRSERNNAVVVSVACYDKPLGLTIAGAPKPKRIDNNMNALWPVAERRLPYMLVIMTPQGGLRKDAKKSYFHSDIDYKTVYEDDLAFRRISQPHFMVPSEVITLAGHFPKGGDPRNPLSAEAAAKLEADMVTSLRYVLTQNYGISSDKIRIIPWDFDTYPEPKKVTRVNRPFVMLNIVDTSTL